MKQLVLDLELALELEAEQLEQLVGQLQQLLEALAHQPLVLRRPAARRAHASGG